jgi:polysaccharide chain length determinant protein (PEP-CTERM system associated)
MRKDISIDLVDSASRPGQLSAFKIDYSARSPQLAEQVNSELTSLFIEENLKLQQQLSESTTSFLQTQLVEARKRLEEQEAKVRAFKAEHLGNLPSQAETNVQILSGLQSQLLDTRRALDGTKQNKLYLESLQQQYQTAQTTKSASGSSASAVEAMEAELSDLRHQLEELRARRTDEHPDVIALKNRISEKEKQKKDLEAQQSAHPEASRAMTTADSAGKEEAKNGAPTSMMQVQSQLKAVNLEIENYEQHVKELESQILSYETRLNLTPQTEQELADVSRGYEESKANYNSLLQKQDQSQLATSLEQRQQGEQFRILDPPSLPNRPSSPNHLLVSLGGLVVGAFLGFGLVVLLETMNEVVRREEDLEGIIPARVLVAVPHLNMPGEDKTNKTFRRLEIGTATIMALLILAGNLYAFYKG